MNKTQIKKFSQYARSTLIPEMQQAISIWKNANIVSGGVQIGNHSYNDSLSLRYSSAVTSLKKQIDKKGEKALAEEAAYIWFNRIVALRFMEVNKYLPTRSSLFSSNDNTGIPEIVKNIDSERNNCGCDKNAIDEYIGKYDIQSIQELYGLILVSICNKLSEHYGFMFSMIDDWTALLFPRTIINDSHILRDKTNGMLNIVDEDWKEVEIIGWIYQYYISERKAELDSSNDKLQNSEEIAASTQLFTPEWIVKYIVHNTVGKLDNLKLSHKIKTENSFDYDVSDLSKFKVLDPASGSGHILVRAYDVLKEIYIQRGHTIDDIPAKILSNNLYGFDIDERAHQLACFAILMKAKADDKNIEKKVDITKNIICIKENNKFEDVNEKKYPLVRSFLKIWYNASMYGALIRIPSNINIKKTKEEFEKFQKENGLVADSICSQNEFEVLLHQTELLNDLYDCVIANPPYKGGDKLDELYKKFLSIYYPEEKSDLFAAFIFRCYELAKNSGYIGMVTMQGWMFISTFQKFRNKLVDICLIDSLIQHGPHGFPEISGEIVQTCSFILNKGNNKKLGKYLNLEKFKTADEKEKKLIQSCIKDDFIEKDQNDFKKIPGTPIIYWLSNNTLKAFENEKMGDVSDLSEGIHTRDNERFLRLWHETSYNKFSLNNEGSSKKRFPINKGGKYRKWFGNNDYVINRENDGKEIRNSKKASIGDDTHFLEEGVSYTCVTSGDRTFRYSPNGYLYDVSGPTFYSSEKLYYLLGFFSSKIGNHYLRAINPGLSLQIGDVKKIPIIFDEKNSKPIDNLVKNCIKISKQDRDSFETSWDFKKHPLIEFKGNNNLLLNCYTEWHNKCVERAQNMKALEEELNKIFSKIYGLEGEIDPTISYDEITIRKADRSKDIKSLLSYIIGCIMGRYSLDQDGLVYAGGKFDKSKYTKFNADDDGIIPILDRDYSDDDIVERTKEFVKKVWGNAFFDGNLNWIAESLDSNNNKTADQVIRDYYNKGFYDDHCHTYQKRPIYWLFISNPSNPKGSAFKALVYMHRYSETTIQDLRRNYVQNYQQKLLEERLRIENNNDKSSQKRVAEINKINTELTNYANKLKDFAEMHQGTIDLDDGVKTNYGMFMDAGIVAKIKL